MGVVTIHMPDGRSWIPKFVREIDQQKCIGCGRCFKVCGRDVLKLGCEACYTHSAMAVEGG